MVNRAPKKSFRVVLKGELDDIDGPFCETERDSLFAFPISVVNRLLGKQACSCTGWRSPSRLTRSVYTVAGFHPSTCNQLRYYACSNCFLRRHRPCSLAIERHLYPASSRIFQFETCVLIATSKKTKWKFVNSNSNDSDRMSRILFLWFPSSLFFSVRFETMFKLFSICASSRFSFPRHRMSSISSFLSSS